MEKRVAIVVLAAGGSRRFGSTKQLFVYQGEPLLRRAVRISLAVSEKVFVVLGAEATVCALLLKDLPVSVCENVHWKEGIASSLRVGVRAAREVQADAVLFLTVDQIRLTSDLLQQFINLYQGRPDEVIAACYEGTRGIPLLFGAGWFDRIEKLAGDEGAKKLILRHNPVQLIDWPDGAIDLDTPQDAAAALELQLSAPASATPR